MNVQQQDPLVDDRELLARFRAGDREAMTTVFDSYSPELARHLARGFSFSAGETRLRVCGLSERGELHDVLAETFRRAFEERARLGYSALSPYGAYLKTIARNLLLDRFRSDARTSWVTLDEQRDGADATADDAPTDAHELVERKELARLMRGFVDDLDKAARRFVELRYQQGLSQDDVAQRMNVSRRKVRKLERGLRAALVEALRGTGYLAPGARGEAAR